MYALACRSALTFAQLAPKVPSRSRNCRACRRKERKFLGSLPPPSIEVIGYPASQDLLLRSFRLSMLHGSAPLLSLQRSRVIPKDYQLVPVVMSMEMARVRMLLADDVGLGKTIEAGLIITELMARQRAARVLFIVPAALREQWQEPWDAVRAELSKMGAHLRRGNCQFVESGEA